MVDVVGGILVRKGRILLVQRLPDKDYPLMWECPGGKVEPEETHEQALKRELREEVGIEVELASNVGRAWWKGEFKNEVSRPDRTHMLPQGAGRAPASASEQGVMLTLYRVRLVSGVPRLMSSEVQGFGYFSPDEMLKLSAAPGLETVRARLAQAMNLGVFEPDGSGHVAMGGT